MNAVVRKLTFLLLVAVGALQVSSVAAQGLSVREALRAVMPTALEALRDMELELGRQFSDEELPTIIGGEDFERRVAERIKGDPNFSPCRIERCLRT